MNLVWVRNPADPENTPRKNMNVCPCLNRLPCAPMSPFSLQGGHPRKAALAGHTGTVGTAVFLDLQQHLSESCFCLLGRAMSSRRRRLQETLSPPTSCAACTPTTPCSTTRCVVSCASATQPRRAQSRTAGDCGPPMSAWSCRQLHDRKHSLCSSCVYHTLQRTQCLASPTRFSSQPPICNRGTASQCCPMPRMAHRCGSGIVCTARHEEPPGSTHP